MTSVLDPRRTEELPATDPSRMRVLYVEDNPADAELTLRGLRPHRSTLEIETVGTLSEAFDRLDGFEASLKRGEPPCYDLVLLDMKLSDGSGIEVLSRIRDRSLPLAVIVLTGTGDEESVMTAIRAGADDYLTKTNEYWIRLPDALRQALEGFRSHAALGNRPIRLLYVEPNRSDVEFVKLHLARHAPFIRLESLESPQQALARLPLKGPVSDVDVILLDFRQTGMNALDLLKELLQVRKLDVPILINTGQGSQEIAILAVKLGAMDYLEKSPGYLHRLPFAIETAFYRSQARRERTALRKSEARLRALIETQPECVKVVDSAGNVLEMNQAGLDMLEASSLQEVQAHRCIDFIRPEYQTAFLQLHQQVMSGQSGILEFEIESLKGTPRRLETHAVPMRDTDGTITSMLEITRDITERRRNEERLAQHEKLSAIGQLAGGIAHDFNNQLAAILGYAELLAPRIPDGELRRYIDTIVQSAKRSRDLTRNLLAFSRQGQYQKIPVDLHQLILETVTLLNRSIDKRITVDLRLQAPSATLIGDPSQLQNALLNLALNARDAMPEGGILGFRTEEIKEEGSDLPDGRYLLLQVSDTGIGMSPEVKKRLFEPFFTTKPVGVGTGMGLASVHGTVALHQGTIRVESETGRGSVFHLRFPLFLAHETAVAESPAPPLKRKLNVLVVDDEETLRAVLADLLISSGHTVNVAGGGREALKVIREHPDEIDLILLDLIMPDMNGWDTLREILSINPAAQVVLTSGFAPNSGPQSAREQGALGFLNKPFEKSKLDALIEQAFPLQSGTEGGPRETRGEERGT